MGLGFFRLVTLLGALFVLFMESAFGPLDLRSPQWEDLGFPREVPRPRGVIVSQGRDLGGGIGDWAVIFRLKIPPDQIAPLVDALCRFYRGKEYTVSDSETIDSNLCSSIIEKQKVEWWRPDKLTHPRVIILQFREAKGLWIAYSEESGVMYLVDWAI